MGSGRPCGPSAESPALESNKSTMFDRWWLASFEKQQLGSARATFRLGIQVTATDAYQWQQHMAISFF